MSGSRFDGRVTVVIPTIPPRADMLARAIASVSRQTRPAAALAVEFDLERCGAPTTRQRALEAAQTEWVAFLDDDDEMLPHHLEWCMAEAETWGADVVVPWFEVVGGTDPFPDNRTVQFDDTEGGNMHAFGITCLVRRSVAMRAFFTTQPWPEDWHYWLELHQSGAIFRKVPEVSWRWHHHDRNTSGKAEGW